MRLAALSLAVLLAGCATKTPAPPTPPAPVATHAVSNPAWAYPSPDGCQASWWHYTSGTYVDWQFSCTGASEAMHGPWGDALSKDSGTTWVAMAWNNSLSKWVQVYTGSALADAEAAVVAYLGGSI